MADPDPTTIDTVADSNWIGDDDEQEHAADGGEQCDLIRRAVYQHCREGGWHRDMRGRSFTVQVSEDGLHVSIQETVTGDGPDGT